MKFENFVKFVNAGFRGAARGLVDTKKFGLEGRCGVDNAKVVTSIKVNASG